jgi:hypothetical protein
MQIDSDFDEFQKLYENGVVKIKKNLNDIYRKDLDRYINEVQTPKKDDCEIHKPELEFLSRMYALIYNKQIPEGAFRWYEVDENVVEEICSCLEELADSNDVYHYVIANFATLWDVINDIENSMKYPVAHNICQMIEQINLDMEMYHDIFKKLNSNSEKNEILTFESSLKKVCDCFNDKLQETYDSVLSDRKQT